MPLFEQGVGESQAVKVGDDEGLNLCVSFNFGKSAPFMVDTVTDLCIAVNRPMNIPLKGFFQAH